MRSLMKGTLAAVLFAAAPAFADEPPVLHGKRLAETNCASCHSVGLSGDSPHEAAPAFRQLSERFPVDTIDEALLVRIKPNHDDMPTFSMTPRQAADIAIYIATIQPESRGRRIVERNCAECHAVGPDDESRHEDAPPFRTLSSLYPLELLEEAFAEGIETGHPDMPAFTATPEQIDTILGYMWSIQAE